jgi:hypothetical protein
MKLRSARAAATAAIFSTICSASLILAAGPAQATCEFPRALTVSDVRAYEGTGAGTKTFQFRIHTSGCTNLSSVSYATMNGSATAPGDYAPKAGTLSWAAGDSTDRFVNVPVVQDSVNEANEGFTLKLSNPQGFTSLPKAIGAGTILDDDGPLKWNVDDRTCTEADAPGFITCSFRITISRAQPVPVSVHFSTVNNSAVTPADYLAISNKTVVMATGSTNTTGAVLVRGDDLCEGNERLGIVLSSPSAGVLADGSAVMTIDNDDFFC